MGKPVAERMLRTVTSRGLMARSPPHLAYQSHVCGRQSVPPSAPPTPPAPQKGSLQPETPCMECNIGNDRWFLTMSPCLVGCTPVLEC